MTLNQERLAGIAKTVLEDRSDHCFRIKVHHALRERGISEIFWEEIFQEVAHILEVPTEKASSRGVFNPTSKKSGVKALEEKKIPARGKIHPPHTSWIEHSLPPGDKD